MTMIRTTFSERKFGQASTTVNPIFPNSTVDKDKLRACSKVDWESTEIHGIKLTRLRITPDKAAVIAVEVGINDLLAW